MRLPLAPVVVPHTRTPQKEHIHHLRRTPNLGNGALEETKDEKERQVGTTAKIAH